MSTLRLTRTSAWLIGALLGAFLLVGGDRTGQLRQHFALVPSRFISGELWQPFTSLLVNASGMALFADIIGLWAFVPICERMWGRRRTLMILFVAGVGSHTFAGLVGAVAGLDQLIGGCSASVLALLVAFGHAWGNQQVLLFGLTPMRAWHVAAFFVGLSLLLSLTQQAWLEATAYLAAVAGTTVWWRGRPSLAALWKLPARWRARRQRRRYRIIQGGRDQRRYWN